MTDLKCLTTREVARLCRVSDATVKRWQQAGLLESERTTGGHRRFRPEDIARFQTAQKLGLPRSFGDESAAAISKRLNGDKHLSDSDLFHALLAGCEEAAANVLIGAYLRGKQPAAIFDETICPAMRQIGELWANGQISITQEHLATRAAHNAVYKFRRALPVSKSNGRLAVCCALEGDFHELPTHLAQTTLETEGWHAINFGANTPLDALTGEIVRRQPDLICISATVIIEAERFFNDYQKLRAQAAQLNIPVILGGRVFRDERIRAGFPAELYARKFSEVAEFVQNLAV